MTMLPISVAKSPAARHRQRRGAAAVEYAAVVFLVLVILALVSMGLLRTRELARDQLCRQRLMLLSKAVNGYEETHGGYPGYINPTDEAQVQSKSWVAMSLPYLVERLPRLQATSEGWEVQKNSPQEAAYEPKIPWPDWKKALKSPVPHLICPSDDPAKLIPGASSYIASSGYADAPENAARPDSPANGIFLDLRKLPLIAAKMVEERDGTQYTLLLSENIQSGSWDSAAESDVGFVWSEKLVKASAESGAKSPEVFALNQFFSAKKQGYKTARPSSYHQGGVFAAFANTRLSKIASNIDPVVYIQLCTVDDTSLVNPWTRKAIGPPIGRQDSEK